MTNSPKLSADDDAEADGVAVPEQPRRDRRADQADRRRAGRSACARRGSRNASATIAAMPAAVTHAIGTMALKDDIIDGPGRRH